MGTVGRSRRILLAGVVLVAVAGLVAWAVGSRVQSPDQAAARASEPEASWITVPVERRVLSSTVVARGDVAPEVSVGVDVPSSVEGAGVVTALGPSAGESVTEGTVLVVVSGRPVFALVGAVPVYRSLVPGMSGDDVAQLQAALSRLGYAPDVDGVFGDATKLAVTAWYADAGFEPVWSDVTDGDVAAARQTLDAAVSALADAESALAKVSGSQSVVVAAQVAVNDAQRRLDDAKASKTEAVTNAQVAVANAQAAYDRVLADAEAVPADREAANATLVAAQTGLEGAIRQGDEAIASAQDALFLANVQLNEVKAAGGVDAARTTRDNAVASRDAAAEAYLGEVVRSGPTVALGEVVFVPSLPARVRSSASALGPVGAGTDAGGHDGSLVELEAGGLVVTTTVRSGDEGLVRVGMSVDLLDETTNTTYEAEVTSIASEATVDASGQLGRAAVIKPVKALPDSLTGVNLRVTVTAASSDGEVLVVPLAAVSAGADGTTRVSVLPAGATVPVDVAVNAGISADGFVVVEPVEPDGLSEGDLVVVGR